jgi:hypothetical protein
MLESKVYAATIGSGAGAILSGFILWLLGVTLEHSPATAAGAVDAAASVPQPVAALVFLAITVGGTLLAGYSAPHTSRPDLSSVVLSVPKMAPTPAVPLLEHFPDPVPTPEPAPPVAPVAAA